MKRSFHRTGALLAGLSVAAVAQAATPIVIDQTAPSIFDSAVSITSGVSAIDLTFGAATKIDDFVVWIEDDTLGNDGDVDAFGGVMSWGLYADDGGAPGALLASGTDDSPAVVAAGYLGEDDVDVARVTVSVDPPVVVDAGTYWLAVHEGAWLEIDDGSSVWWGATGPSYGSPPYSTHLETNPSSWVEGTQDNVFLLVGDRSLADQSVAKLNDAAWTITSWKQAVDFVLEGGQLPLQSGFGSLGHEARFTVEVLLTDSASDDDGVLDNFGGILSWAILNDSSGAPGSTLRHGSTTDLRITDTGSTTFGSEVFRVRFRIDTDAFLESGQRYWLALKEGGWTDLDDGTDVSWVSHEEVVGIGKGGSSDETISGAWGPVSTEYDLTLRLFVDAVFHSGFESGTTCGWTGAVGSTACP